VAGQQTDIAAAKQRLRVACLAARDAMTPSERSAAGAALARHGIHQWRGRGRGAADLEFGAEPPMRPLLDLLTDSGTEIVVPVVRGDDLDWVVYVPQAAVTTSQVGVDEPTGRRLGAAALATADVIVVPALAVDHLGNRLGRGRGYYDRALAEVSGPVVAVGYDDELVESVPVERHDRVVQAMLRPSGYSPF
jgi:5-formyltetrahydrofolate cyclo-ligase